MKKRMTSSLMLVLALLFVVLLAMPTKAQLSLTQEERDYVNKGTIIQAVSLDGSAPLQYVDKNGQVQGISKEVLEEIARMTGLKFEYQLYDTLNEAFNSGAHIVFGIPHHYAPENMILSVPYLESETILFINSSVDPNELPNLIYAAVRGSNLPEGIEEDKAVYFETREESMNAVEQGKADYGYGNAYSVSFYRLQNNYRNIITVPEVKETRAYCIGFLTDDAILRSIVNKAIPAIDAAHFRNLVLGATTQIDRNVTIPMIVDAYGLQIFSTIFLVIAGLSFSVFYTIRAKNELKLQYGRYQILAQTSNEYLYEYHVRTKHLELSDNCLHLFGSRKDLRELADLFHQTWLDDQEDAPIVELPLSDGKKGLFKSIHSPIYDDKGRVYSIIGKLIDVSKEEAEKRELIRRSEIDGLTGLYNASTARERITERLMYANPESNDALVLIDCDKFKAINDTHGHLQGDEILASISQALVQNSRKTDIIGRIGGDEFCVYLRDVPSKDFVDETCQKLMTLIRESCGDDQVTVSIGIALLGDEKTYDELFRKADSALYDAKRRGRGQIQFSSRT